MAYIGLGIRDSKAKSGGDSGLKVCSEGGMLTITLGITGFLEIFGRDYGFFQKPIGDPHDSVISHCMKRS